MKKVQFSDIDEDTCVVVTVDDEDYGRIYFDYDKDAFVLWPNATDDGSTYFNDLFETETTIEYELTHAED